METFQDEIIAATLAELRAKQDEVNQIAQRLNHMNWGRIFAMGESRTFQLEPLYRLARFYIRKTGENERSWLEPFAGVSRFAPHTITNDINPDFETDHNEEALDFLRRFEDESVDGVIFDPPLSPRQLKEMYDNWGARAQTDDGSRDTRASWLSTRKRKAGDLVKPGGYFIMLAYNSNGFQKDGESDFELIEGFNVHLGGSHNDIIVSVWRKLHEGQVSHYQPHQIDWTRLLTLE